MDATRNLTTHNHCSPALAVDLGGSRPRPGHPGLGTGRHSSAGVQKSLILLTLAALLFLVPATGAGAQEVSLEASLEFPVVLAGGPRTTWLKVGVRGFEWTQDTQRPALNVALVLDRSGSMEGEKLERAKDAARYAVELLGPRDILSIVTYETGVQVLLPATKVSDKRAILRLIDGIHTDGSTALFAGVTKGGQEVRKFLSREHVNRVILLSDGLANVGPGSPAELAELGVSLRREGMAVSTIGLGLDYNEDLMTRLAQASDGNHAFVQEPRDLVAIFNAEFRDALSVVARDMELVVRCADGVRPLRILNREGSIRGSEVRIPLSQIYSQQEKYVLVEVELPALLAGSSRNVAQVSSTYFNLKSRTTRTANSTVQVRATLVAQEQEQSRAKDVSEAIAIQKNVATGEEAIRLRDEGRVEEAKELLEKSAEELNILGSLLNSPGLQAAGAAAAEDAEAIQDDQDWQATRKSMKAEQFSAENQQTYPQP